MRTNETPTAKSSLVSKGLTLSLLIGPTSKALSVLGDGVGAEKDRIGVFGGEEERNGVRSGPGEARTMLLLHIISARPCKQPLMIRAFLKVYMELGSYFVSARTNKRHHHQFCQSPRGP
jgi:hypothetical protein